LINLLHCCFLLNKQLWGCLQLKYVLPAVCFIMATNNVAIAQKQNNIWVFGKYAGLDFNTSPPSPLDSMPIGFDPTQFVYASSVCDSNGKLIMYTDGITVWNQHKKPIARYLQRWPWSGYCMPLIVPHPENDSLFYIFGVSASSYAYRLQYLTVNPTRYFGYGEIIYPQPSTLSNYFTVLKENASVMVAGTAHCNKKDIWVVTHAQNAFYAYLITKNGVAATPIVSSIPPDIVPEGKYEQGNLKFSASGEKLIMPLMNTNEVAVFSFNNAIGTFSDGFKLKLPEGLKLEDAELSPDGSKLYFGGSSLLILDEDAPVTHLHSIQQWNLDAGSPTQIEQSVYNLTPLPDRTACFRVCYVIDRTLQLGPDGKIYVSMRHNEGIGPQLDKTASVINAPNAPGALAFYKPYAVNVGRVYNYIHYNYIRSFVYTAKENGIQYNKSTCSDQPVAFSLLYNRVDAVSWDFGDPASGANNYSQSLKPAHTYPAPGTYSVKALIRRQCATDTAFAQVTISEDKAVHVPLFIQDTILCVGTRLNLNAATSGATGYLWESGRTTPEREIKDSGTYEIKVINNCSVDERLFTVKYQKCDCNIYVPTAFTPNGDGLNDYFKPVVKCSPGAYKFQIYNRFGAIVYQTTDIQAKGWNGKIKSEDAGQQTYIWRLFYKDPNSNYTKSANGTVTLLR